MKQDRLSEIEINSIVEDYEIRKKEGSIIENYKNSCPNFKNGKCAGSVNLDSRFGCNLCIKKGIYDLNNAMPPINSREYSKIQEEKIDILFKAVKNCKLSFDNEYCRYKNIFNYCVYCKKEFRRER
ncbi:MAG: hypothetical protein J6J27_04435 [Alphaproteobacteria bacterium]|nr:hypothetical protein [Alphaproteobacteria bacterium]